MGVAIIAILTAYRFYVRRQNALLDAGGEKAIRAMKGGVSQQQIDLGWRYVGY